MVFGFIVGFMIGGLLLALIVQYFAMKSLRDAWAKHADSLREHNRFIIWVGKEYEGMNIDGCFDVKDKEEGIDIDEYFNEDVNHPTNKPAPFPTEFAKWYSEYMKLDDKGDV